MIDPTVMGQAQPMVAAMAPAAGPPGPPGLPPGAPQGPPPGPLQGPPPDMPPDMAPPPGAPLDGPPPGPGGPPPDGGPPPKKPPLLLPPRLAKDMAQAYVDQVHQMSQLIADQTGPPDDFKRFKRVDQVAAWYKRDPRQDPAALKEQGLSAVEIRDKVYPLRAMLLKMAGPRPTDRVRFAQAMKVERMKQEQAGGPGQGETRPGSTGGL